jgi:hypothetical protein
MKKLALKTLNWLGMDRAVLYTLMARGWGWIAGMTTILAIARFLTREEQGYYYTFVNLLAFQVYFEMGLAYVILQFASHEKSKLKWNPNGLLEGDHAAKARLKTLMHFAVRWYGVMACISMAIVLPAGLLFFKSGGHTATGISWQAPWIWFATVAALNVLLSPLLAMIEGCGLVPEVAGIRLRQSIAGYIMLWIAMFSHMRLFAVPIFNTTMFLFGAGWLVFKYHKLLLNIYRYKNGTETLHWRNEIWPFQWKIALSAASGYFVFQFFTPVLFKFRGPTEAGQMGMSISVTGAILAIGMAWISTKAAPFGTLVAAKDYRKLDKIWFSSLCRSVSVVAAAGLAMWTVVYHLHKIHHHLASRLLDPVPLGMLAAVSVFTQIVFAEAAYLRAHKQEPFLVPSVIGSLLTGASTYFLGKSFGASGMIAGCFALSLLGVPINTWIFLTKRRQWQAEAGYSPSTLQDYGTAAMDTAA